MGKMAAGFSLPPQKKAKRWVGRLKSNYLCDKTLVLCYAGPCSSGCFALLNQTY